MTTHTCTNAQCAKDFRIIPQEQKFYDTKGLPVPNLCPACRHRQRMALRSERQLYRRKCNLTGETILSVYPEDAPYKIYSHKAFWENIE